MSKPPSASWEMVEFPDLVQGPSATPLVIIEAPAADQSIPNTETSFGFSGTAVTSVDRAVVSVLYQVNNEGSMTATGTASWNFTAVGLVEGLNRIDVRAVDAPIGGGQPGPLGPIVSRFITRLGPGNDPASLTILVPPTDETIRNSVTEFTFAGTATDPQGDLTLDRVEYQVNSGSFTDATGTDMWAFTATGLAEGPNVIVVRPVDDMGAIGAAD